MSDSSSMVATLQHTLKAHGADVNGLSFSADSFATCSSDKTVKIWSLSTYAELPSSPLCEHAYAVRYCSFSPAGNLLATCSTDGKCIVWDTCAFVKLFVLQHPSQACIRVCRFSPSGDLLATGADDEKTALWSVGDRKLVKTFGGHEESVTALAFSPEGSFLVTGCTAGALCVWDAEFGHARELTFISEGHDLGLTSCDFSPTYGSAGAPSQALVVQSHFLLATCGFDNCVKLWDFVAYIGTTNVQLKLRDTLLGHQGSVHVCCFSHSGKILASGSCDHTIKLWDPLKGLLLHTVDAHSRYVTSCAFSLDDQILASGSNDRTVKLWRITSEENLTDQASAEDVLVDLSVNTSDRVTACSGDFLLSRWSVNDVCKFISDLGFPEYAATFERNAIDGAELANMTEESLTSALGISALGHRNKILRTVEQLKGKTGAAKKKGSKDEIPDEFLCPITREVMRDPVIAADGYTYERAAILAWIQSGKGTSPMTNSPLQNHNLTPNRSLKMLIQRG